MKKKILLLSAISALAVGAISATLIGGADSLKSTATGVERTISFTGYDVMEGVVVGETSDSYTSGDVTLKTDQLKNDVTFHYDDCECYEFNDAYYLQLKGETGCFYNVSEIRSIECLEVYCAGTFKVEWGFEVDGLGNPIYVKSEQRYVSFYNYVFWFEETYPNYIKISNVDSVRRQLTDFVFTLNPECKHSESPYAVKNGLMFKKYDTYASCIGFADEPFADVVIPATVDELPVEDIYYDAFRNQTAIETLSLPSGLKYIEDGAFQGCVNIGAIEIPNTVEGIYRSAFEDTYMCKSLTFEAGGTELLSLGTAAFENNGHEGVLTLPSRVGGISYDGYTFEYMFNVTEYALNSDNVEGNKLSVEDGVLFFSENSQKILASYPDANPRTSYTIPSDVTRVMCNDGFCDAIHLETLNVAPANGVSIFFDGYSCTEMDNLSTLNLGGEGHIIIYWYAFRTARSLKDVVIPENVEVRQCGFGSMDTDTENPTKFHLVASKIPDDWNEEWDGGMIASGYATVDFNYAA